MTEAKNRIESWLEDMVRTLDTAESLVGRGEAAFHTDAALPLAFEALSNRVGDLAKKLTGTDADRFGNPVWSQAARNRDFVVHQYHRLDYDLLWATVSVEFPKLARIVRDELPEG